MVVLEEGDKLAVEMAHPRRARALHEARSHGVEFFAGASLRSIGRDSVEYVVADEVRTAKASQVIIASGVEPDHALADTLRAEGFDARVIGDAERVGYIEGAIRSGYVTARRL